MTAEFILQELLSVANPEKARFLQGFFKTGKGQYAEILSSEVLRFLFPKFGFYWLRNTTKRA